jgi:N-acetylmuramoyl-L-alanine amidase
MKKHRNKIFFLLMALVVAFSFITFEDTTPLSALSKLGSKGQEVRNIQSRLKEWGYYKGSIDGVYGQQTKNAVIKFQKKNGLKADGIAGNATHAAIGLPTSGGGSSSSSSNVNLLARIINGEARGETYEGQVAVGAVVLNRVEHPSFPNSIAGVIYQPQAFTAVDDGQINASVTASCIRAAKDALNGWDPTGGAIYYYNPAKTTSKWIYSRPVVTTIGAHVFAK